MRTRHLAITTVLVRVLPLRLATPLPASPSLGPRSHVCANDARTIAGTCATRLSRRNSCSNKTLTATTQHLPRPQFHRPAGSPTPRPRRQHWHRLVCPSEPDVRRHIGALGAAVAPVAGESLAAGCVRLRGGPCEGAGGFGGGGWGISFPGDG